MNNEEFDLILEEGEGYLIEFKESASDSIAKEIVAFANSSGGRIFIGITDDNAVKGIRVTNTLKSRIQTIARNCDPSIPIEISTWENVLIVTVLMGTDKPYSCKEGFFIRAGPNSQKLTRDEIIDYFAHEGKIRFDEQFAMKFTYPEDFSQERYQEFLERCGIKANLPPEQVLMNLGLIERQGGQVLMKNAGVLLFAKDPTQFHFHAIITCVRFRGTDKTYIIDRKDFSDDIITNLENAMKWLMTYIPLRYEIGGKKLERDEIPEIPYDVLREAISNSVIHRDYFEKGAVTMVEYFDDHIRITNPGGLVKGIPPEEFGITSMSRNPLIQGLFHRAHLVEKIGSGIGRMRDGMKEHSLEEPEISWNGIFNITFKRPEVTEEVTGITVEGTEHDDTPVSGGSRDLRIEKILELIAAGKIIRRPDIEAIFRISQRTAHRDLAQLTEKEFISFIGPPKSGKYEITEKGKQHIEATNKGS